MGVANDSVGGAIVGLALGLRARYIFGGPFNAAWWE
jgi:hypothetical protein